MENVTLTTKRLTLRPPVAADAREIHRYNREEAFWRYTTIPQVPPTLETTQAFIARIMDDHRKTPRRLWHFIICETETGRNAGDISLRLDADAPWRAGFGYGLDPALHGRGYMTEALARVLQFGFEELGLKRIHATADPGNTASRRVMEKCGLSYEGTRRGHTLIRGTCTDDACYGILREEFTPLRG